MIGITWLLVMSRSLGIFVRKYVCNDNIQMNGSYGHGHTIMRCHTDIWYQSSAHRLEYCDGMAGCEPVFCITPPIVTNEVVFDGHTDASSQDQEKRAWDRASSQTGAVMNIIIERGQSCLAGAGRLQWRHCAQHPHLHPTLPHPSLSHACGHDTRAWNEGYSKVSVL